MFDRLISAILPPVQKIVELMAFVIFILFLLLASSLFLYSVYYFVTKVVIGGIFANDWNRTVINSLHFIEIALLAMLVNLLAPITFRFCRFCAMGEVERLREIRLGLMERWIGSILITIIASFLLEKLAGPVDTPIYTYLGGVLTIFALGFFIYVMRDDPSSSGP